MADYPPAPGSPRYQPFAQRMAAASADKGAAEGLSSANRQQAGAAEMCAESAVHPEESPRDSPASLQPGTCNLSPSAVLDGESSGDSDGSCGNGGASPACAPTLEATQQLLSQEASPETQSSKGYIECEGTGGSNVPEGGEEGCEGGLQLGNLTEWYTQTLAALASEESLRGGHLGFSGREDLDSRGGGVRVSEASGARLSSLQMLLPDGTEPAPYTGEITHINALLNTLCIHLSLW